ncbi:MAG TPA: hypothetical protein VM054_11585 [bacterium]|nr:hypothetical protein [bacterium]
MFVILYVMRAVFRFLFTFGPLAMVRMVTGMTFSPIAQRISWKRLPAEAERLGLTFTRSKSYSEFGEITGTVRGHGVEVEPDSDAMVSVGFGPCKINLVTRRPSERPDEGMEDFTTPSGAFNLIFHTRRAAPELAEVFRTDPELTRAFHRYYLRWMWRLDSIYVFETRIICNFTWGQYFFFRIPAGYLEMLVEDTVGLAESLEAALA